MSPILIAFLAVYCCIVGFVFGLIIDGQKSLHSYLARKEASFRCSVSALQGMDFEAKRKVWDSNCDPKGFEK